jgi:uncharacterized protein (DUF1800 family)
MWLSLPLCAGTFPANDEVEAELIKRRIRAAQFLARATFGPTRVEIDTLADRMSEIGDYGAFEEWIDTQFNEPTISLHEVRALDMVAGDGFTPDRSDINITRYRDYAWWDIALRAPDQLRQRVAWALSQIVVVNQNVGGFNDTGNDLSGQPLWLGVTDYYDMLVRNAFTNYRTVLYDVTLHPIMGNFLSHLRNRKADLATGREPDENYARESEQLFSIGLYLLSQEGVIQRNPDTSTIPAYTEDDVRSFSRVFTGLSYARTTSFFQNARNYHEPMIMFQAEHDTATKTLLNGTVLPANQPGLQDISDGVDNLFNHPNVGPFVGRLLIQRLVKSNPSRGYIQRVTQAFNDNGSGVRGDMKAVVKAILLDPEALRSLLLYRRTSPLRIEVGTRGTEHSRLQEPMLRFTAFVRAFNSTSDYATGRFMIPSLDSNWKQGQYRSPSVFNFYLPDFQPQGEITSYVPTSDIPNGAIFAPEFQLLDAVTSNRTGNRYRSDVYNEYVEYTLLNNSVATLRARILYDFSYEKTLATDPAALVQHLDLLLCHGTMTDAHRQALVDALTQETTNTTSRARAAILSVLISPACSIHE